MSKQTYPKTDLEIAIIGMAVRFPGAETLQQFWYNLKNSKESITFFSDEQLQAAGIEQQLIDHPNYIKAKGVVNEGMGFDCELFGYSHREAKIMDPQLRIYHECVFQALADASCQPDQFAGQIGIYGGVGSNLQWATQFLLGTTDSAAGMYEAGNLNGQEFFNTRIANKFNFTGPALTVQTACSSSLVAVHLAAQGLIAGDCDIALAGGVKMTTASQQELSDISGHLYQEGMIYSKDGHCCPFDANASGTVPGDGAGIVVLKRLEDAISDGDNIYAVIKGSAINNDGNDKAGFTAPSVKGQVQAIQTALEMAEVEAETVSYIEAHGTGTSLGDPIEIKALTAAFASEATGFCRIGSVKSNIGHLGSAAGIAGLIKTVLSLKHQQIPASLHYQSPNPEIDFNNSPFVVNSKLQTWQDEKYPLRAGVSSFGIGGTNAHVVLEEYIETAEDLNKELLCQESAHSSPQKLNHTPSKILTLSSTSESSLAVQREQMAEYLSIHPQADLNDIEYCLQTGRHHLPKRQVVIGDNFEQLIHGLTNVEAANCLSGTSKKRQVIFMFPGQGVQYNKMAVQLYQTHASFRNTVDNCFDLIDFSLSSRLKNIFLESAEHENLIDQTQYTQPLLFIVEYSLAVYLIELGISPWAMIGHSIGEYVAATIAGVFELNTALELVILRGQLMANTSSGAMLAVAQSEQELIKILPAELSLAAINTENGCVVSGDTELVELFAKKCEQLSIKSKQLKTSHGYHSSLMDPVLDEFSAAVVSKQLNTPSIPYISNLTANWISAEQLEDENYWSKHLRQGVRFSNGLTTLLEKEDLLFIEVGPGQTLSTFVRQHKANKGNNVVITMLPKKSGDTSELQCITSAVARLHLAGQLINWQYYHQIQNHQMKSPKRLALPGYVFNRTQFLPNPIKFDNDQPFQRSNSEQAYLYVPDWYRTDKARNSIKSVLSNQALADNWLLFIDDDGYGAGLSKLLREQGKRVITVSNGESYQRLDTDHYSIKLAQPNDYLMLFQELTRLQAIPENIVHLLNLSKLPSMNTMTNHDALDISFYSLIYLAQTIGQMGMKKLIRLCVASTDLHSVSGLEQIDPQKATLLGAVRVITQEYPNIECQNIDLCLPANPAQIQEQIFLPILSELMAEDLTQLVAYRGFYRWLRKFQPQLAVTRDANESNEMENHLVETGHYVITGGLGGIGLSLAKGIAQKVKAQFTLLSRQGLPKKDLWTKWLSQHDAENATSIKIRSVQALEALGSQVLVIKSDVSHAEQLKDAVKQSIDIHGPVRGVIHAAGVPGGGAIQLKDRATADNVLAAKINGTQLLAEALEESNPDFVCLCSSITSILGGFGQADYCAANAYLDACVYSGLFSSTDFVFSINWDPWKEVGMAVNTARDGLFAYTTKIHPLLGVVTNQSEKSCSFKAHFSSTVQWVLNEHRILDQPTVPGTTYVEMARAAFNYLHNDLVGEFENIYFLAPLVAQDDEWFEVVTEFTPQSKESDAYLFVITSQLFGKGPKVENAKGIVRPLATEVSATKTLSEVFDQCGELTTDDPRMCVAKMVQPIQEEVLNKTVDCGPRWDLSKQLAVGKKEGVMKLALSLIHI